jgi:hypothetical protein
MEEAIPKRLTSMVGFCELPEVNTVSGMTQFFALRVTRFPALK